MNNFKKIGLTALAGSLVATSVFAGELTATGAASIGASNITGSNDQSNGVNWSMGNSVTLSGSGELDNGLTVTMSMELDAGAEDTGGPFDSQSIKVASDTLGTLVFAGHGGSSAQSAMDTTAAGDIWNQTLGITGPTAAAAGNDSLYYTLPEMMDGLALSASMSPGRAGQETHTSVGVVYTGVEGLTVKLGQGDSGAPGAETESTTMMASYAIGSLTLSASRTDVDYKNAATDETWDSYQVAYTISENISATYGSETIETEGTTTDEEVTAFGVSYTSGGMTISASQINAEGAANSATADSDKWSLSAAFAF